MTTLTFPTLADLHRNRRIAHGDHLAEFREDSHDFGIDWRGAARGSRFRLTWIGPRFRYEGSAPPGELYLASLHGDSYSVELLCVIPPIPDSDGVRPDENVQNILDGWADVCGEPDSVAWVRDRVAEALRAGWATPAVAHV